MVEDLSAMDEYYMQEALQLAKKAQGKVAPNPLVGAVIVSNSTVVAHGWHMKSGREHAEIHALRMAGDLAVDATLYVTLEPCSHYGKTPPCVDAIIRAGIKRVVIATKDPNPLVSGSGIEKLQKAGIVVKSGVLKREAQKLNEIFFTYMLKKRPFIALKFAMSLDGKIATYTGSSKWITGEAARCKGHQLRDMYDAIVVGSSTLKKDDPTLTTRLKNKVGKNPIRIVLSSKADIPLEARVFNDKEARTLLVTTDKAPKEKIEKIMSKGVEVLAVPSDMEEKIDLAKMVHLLAKREITSLLIEGGGTLHFSFLQAQLVDKIYAFIAPKIIGGKEALGVVSGRGFQDLKSCMDFDFTTFEKLDDGNIFLVADFHNLLGKEDFSVYGYSGRSWKS